MCSKNNMSTLKINSGLLSMDSTANKIYQSKLLYYVNDMLIEKDKKIKIGLSFWKNLNNVLLRLKLIKRSS